MRRILPLIMVAAILLGACTPSVTLFTREPESTPTADSASAAPAATAAPSATPTPVPTLDPNALRGIQITFVYGTDGQTASLLTQLAAEFNLANPWGIQAATVPQNNLSQLADVIENGQQPFDLVLALPEQALAWQNKLADLTPYVNHPAYGISPADMPPAFWEQSAINGLRLGVPAIRSAQFLFYNVTWAKELGFDTAPLTWDEFQKQACAANASWKTDADQTNDGYGGLALDTTSNWQSAYGWLHSLGASFVDGDKLTFDTPANTAAFQHLADLRAQGCAWLPGSPSHAQDLAARRALFITGSLNDLSNENLAFAHSADAWTVLPFPGADTPAQAGVPVYGLDFSLGKSSAARQLAAWMFVQWLLQPEQQTRWAKDAQLLPTRNAALEALKNDPAASPQWRAAISLMNQAVTYPQTASWKLAKNILADGFQVYFQAFPNAAPKDILAEMDATIKELAP